jgi:phage gp36-like protein
MGAAEEPPPEQSCTNLFDTQNINDFEAVSVEFELDDATATLDSFPEDRFRDQISSHLKLDTRDLLIIR